MNIRIALNNEPIELQDVDAITPASKYLATPRNNFGCQSAARAVVEIFSDTTQSDVIWQVDVYNEARVVAEQRGLQNVIDVGCGGGDKLHYYFDKSAFNTVGIDFLNSLARAREQYHDRRWIACDITQNAELRKTFASLREYSPAVVILSDVIEHIVDVRPLLSELRSFMEMDERSRFIVSTPDRSRLEGRDPDGFPPNPAHVREWSLDELVALFASAGFKVERAGHTRANQFDDHYSTSFLELSFSKSRYLTWLREQGVIRHDLEPSHLFITTEFQGLGPSGGIGTVVDQQRRAYGAENALIVHINDTPNQAADRYEHGVLSTADLFDDPGTLSLPFEEQALHAVQQLLFFFPSLKTVQYQDYTGIGCRIAQAAAAGMLPDSLRTIVHCHGAVHYLENGQEEWIGLPGFGRAEREKIAIELSRTVVFPSRFLRDLYAEAGIAADHADRRILGYPYDFPLAKYRNYRKADTLIFVGKRTRMKGFLLFLDALSNQGLEQVLEAGIKRIIIIGPLTDEDSNARLQLERLRHVFEIEEHIRLSRTELLEFAERWIDRAIFVLPYMADNQPLTILDIVSIGGLPVMLRAGGVPEMLPDSCAPYLLAEPNASALRERILDLIMASPTTRTDYARRLRKGTVAMQQQIRQGILELETGESSAAFLDPHSITATVVIPFFNTDLKYIRDLVWALNHQTIPPKEVLFVDDASETSAVDALEELVSRELKLPWRLIKHSINKGLAGARNTALFSSESELLLNIDSDDIPHNNFVRDIVYCFSRDPETVVAVPYLEAFDDDTNYNFYPHVGYVYRPIGTGLIAGLTDNHFGHANSGFKIDTLRNIGGWDESDKTKYEDWALYLRLAARGCRISIIPQAGCLYRVRSSSMVRTYNTWPAWKRLARSIDVLPRYESFRLQALARDYLRVSQAEGMLRDELAALQRERDELFAERHALQVQAHRRSHRILNAIDRRLRAHPRVFHYTYTVFVKSFIWGGKLRRRLRRN
ncbi:glycosyltransferase [Microvirga sp. BT688]|uniref:glycosyltransferase n=1 Tax=Microvirga sp. TaxID=1873136 RepID=UPI0016895E3A|nr:glycosyltransferase [Microvirga sp.]MBD2750014.1 glycosyltransferase [Microvirga sp.]